MQDGLGLEVVFLCGCSSKKATGILIIYAKEPCSFGTSEIYLLEKLSAELGDQFVKISRNMGHGKTLFEADFLGKIG